MSVQEGVLFIVSAPSGAGKTSLIQALRAREPGLQVAVSYTTRPPRPGEIDGVHYHFVDRETFLQMRQAGAFLESAEVFGNYYGTTEESVRQGLRSGRDLLLEIDWQGARQVRKRFPQAVSLFILPPSQAVLAERLRGRGQDEESVIAKRLAEAAEDMRHGKEYDYLIINEDFSQALEALQCILRTTHLRLSSHRDPRVQALVFHSAIT